MKKAKEVRFAEIAPSGVSDLTIVGNPVVFEDPTTITLEDGSTYTEIIHRGALDECDLRDSTLCINHDDTRIPRARTGRTMKLTVTEEGLHMIASLAGDNQTARDVYSAVKRGDLSGMSFAFVVPDGGSRYDATTNTRHIDRIARILEVSIVNRPAYASASVEARDEITAARDAARAKAQARALRIAALARSARIINQQIG